MEDVHDPQIARNKKRKRRVIRFGLGALGVAMLVLGYKEYVRTSCEPFYEEAYKGFEIPGIGNGFVPQDMFFLDDEKTWLFSGYDIDRKESPIYKVKADGTVIRNTVTLPDGSIYKGHGAAITASSAYAFLTVDDGYVVLERSKLADAVNGRVVHAFAHVPVPLEPAFMNVHEDMLYVGEFYERIFYDTPKDHRVKTFDGEENPALICAYESDPNAPYGFSQRVASVYSIPKYIQGMCITDDGKMVLSQAWGLGDAHVLVHDMEKIPQEGTISIDGQEAPLFVLDGRSLVKTLVVPPMAEGIDYHDGRVYMPNEAASNLFLIGKFDGSRNIFSFEV